MKERFNTEYDEHDAEGKDYYSELKQTFDKQAELNQQEFANMDPSTRAQYEGFRVGTYVRVEITAVPCEFVKNFNPHNPVIIGGLLFNEEGLGFIQVLFSTLERIYYSRFASRSTVGIRKY